MCNYGSNHCPGCGKCVLNVNFPDPRPRGARCYACLGQPRMMKSDLQYKLEQEIAAEAARDRADAESEAIRTAIPEFNNVIFEGGYGRKGTMRIGAGECHRCHQPALVLGVDSSEGEYGAGCICLDCVQIMFTDMLVAT